MERRKFYPLRWCTGGGKNPEHHPHLYRIDPVDGELPSEHLCPGNSGPKVRELLEDGEPTCYGFIEFPDPLLRTVRKGAKGAHDRWHNRGVEAFLDGKPIEAFEECPGRKTELFRGSFENGWRGAKART